MKKTALPQKKREDIDGVILLDKPEGVSSNSALVRVKRLLNAKKGGHTGTLDPFATGLLPLCFGEATKFSQDLLDADKTYVAAVRLGVKTSTGDTEGEVLEERPVPDFSRDEIERILSGFRGEISQVPPMYSALKRDGKPLYEYARAGIELEREARRVTIHELVLAGYEPPCMTIRVRCSKGTYIRVLGEDIGNAAGCGAHLESLRRTGAGPLTLEGAVPLAALEEMAEKGEALPLLPADCLVSTFPAVELPEALSKRFGNGQRLAVLKEGIRAPEGGRVRVLNEKKVFLGTALVRNGVLAPERLVSVREKPVS